MIRFANYIALLTLIVCNQVAIPAIQVRASDEQNSLIALGFNQCDNNPCYLEIVPGKTTWVDASGILLKQNFTKDASNLFFSKEEPIQGGIHVNRVPDNPDVVNSVSFSDLNQKYKITLADVLELYDYPCKAYSDSNGSFWFSYPNMLVHALSDTKRDFEKASVIFINLVDPELPISISGINVCTKTEYSMEYLLWFTF